MACIHQTPNGESSNACFLFMFALSLKKMWWGGEDFRSSREQVSWRADSELYTASCVILHKWVLHTPTFLYLAHSHCPVPICNSMCGYEAISFNYCITSLNIQTQKHTKNHIVCSIVGLTGWWNRKFPSFFRSTFWRRAWLRCGLLRRGWTWPFFIDFCPKRTFISSFFVFLCTINASAEFFWGFCELPCFYKQKSI